MRYNYVISNYRINDDMKRLATILVLSALLLSALPASAQVNRRATSTDRANKATSSEKVQKRIELQLDIVKRKVGQTAKTLNATIERLGNIIGRIESRIEKVKSAGGNTVESETAIAEAKKHLQLAKDSMAKLSLVELKNETLRENFTKVKEAAAEVKTHLREAHREMMKAVRLLKTNN